MILALHRTDGGASMVCAGPIVTQERQMIERMHSKWTSLRRSVREERGAALIVVASGMLALTSAVALAVDVGLLTTARLEAQRAADSAALAGAGAFVGSPGNEELARFLATEYAKKNKVRGSAVVLEKDDIEVDTEALTVKVTVWLIRDRGTAVPTVFARVFGIDLVDVAATATAEATAAGGIPCLLPVAVPDRWYENGGAENDPADFDAEMGDYYIPWADPESDGLVINEGFTGYSEADLGHQIALKSNDGEGSMNSSWYYPWRPPLQYGAEDYRENIKGCVDPSISFHIGIEVDSEPGNMACPTMQGFKELINLDPSASWNGLQNCIVDAGLEFSTEAASCRREYSPRIRAVPLFDPTEEPELGSKPFKFTNFAGLFIEKIEGKTVYARWIGYTGVKPGNPDDGTTAGPLFKALRLID
jgi:hypothetical protein